MSCPSENETSCARNIRKIVRAPTVFKRGLPFNGGGDSACGQTE